MTTQSCLYPINNTIWSDLQCLMQLYQVIQLLFRNQHSCLLPPLSAIFLCFASATYTMTLGGCNYLWFGIMRRLTHHWHHNPSIQDYAKQQKALCCRVSNKINSKTKNTTQSNTTITKQNVRTLHLLPGILHEHQHNNAPQLHLTKKNTSFWMQVWVRHRSSDFSWQLGITPVAFISFLHNMKSPQQAIFCGLV